MTNGLFALLLAGALMVPHGTHISLHCNKGARASSSRVHSLLLVV